MDEPLHVKFAADRHKNQSPLLINLKLYITVYFRDESHHIQNCASVERRTKTSADRLVE